MKKFLAILLLTIVTIGFAFADSVAVKKRGEVVGSIEYSYTIKQFDDGSCSIVITLENTSDEYVHGWITLAGIPSDAVCERSFDVSPYKTDEIYILCKYRPSRVILTNVYVN